MFLNKVCFILRGIPGCGKSTVASYIASIRDWPGVVCCADDFFMDEYGNYKFNPSQLGIAHKICLEKFTKCIDRAEPLVILANTATRLSEFKEYKEIAERAGYTVFSLIVENRHGGVNTHGVPAEKLEQMKQRMEIQL